MTWNSLVESYQMYLKMTRRRYFIETIYPVLSKEYGLNKYEDVLLDELEFGKMLPDTDYLIFRDTKIIIADHPGNMSSVLQHIKAMIELIPFLEKIPTLSADMMYMSMLALGIWFPNLSLHIERFGEEPNPYSLHIFRGREEVSVTHHNLDELLEKIVAYSQDAT